MNTDKNKIRFIASSLQPFKWWVVAATFITTTWTLCWVAEQHLLKTMVDSTTHLVPGQTFQMLGRPILLFMLLWLYVIISYHIHDIIWLNLKPKLKKALTTQLMSRMMNQSPTFYQDSFVGSLSSKINDVATYTPNLLQQIINKFFHNGLTLLIAVGTLAYISTTFGLICSVWVILYILLSLAKYKHVNRLSSQAAGIRANIVGYIVDVLENMINLRLFSGKKAEKKKLDSLLDTALEADQKRDYFLLQLFVLQGASFLCYQAVCFYFLLRSLEQGLLTPGSFVLIFNINILIVTRLEGLTGDIQRFVEGTGKVLKGIEVALAPIQIEDRPTASALVIQKGEISFKDVHFRYQKDTPLFHNLSITLQPSQKVGLVGYSGSGKSTFVKLILRLHEVSSGKILIDGQDIKQVTQASLYKNIGIVPQEPSIFNRSLIENIRYSRMDATDGQVIEASIEAHTHTFIMNLPLQYNTLVGARGSKLSGGEKQRIAIARAALKKSPIFILDEATSQLDSITETKIQASLEKLMQEKTTIVVAHRLSTLLKMDRILVFEQGKIIEDGTHQELLEKNGVYKTLWEKQIDGFIPSKK